MKHRKGFWGKLVTGVVVASVAVVGAVGVATLAKAESITLTSPSIYSASAFNSTGAGGFQFGGTVAFTTFANAVSPIVSSEVANAPLAAGYYVSSALTRGFNATAGVNTYAEMLTAKLTINGTISNHWGMIEHTVDLVAGTGTPVMSGELNVEKSLVTVPAGVALGNGENLELTIENSGAITIWHALVINPTNKTTGTITGGGVVGVYLQLANSNPTANTIIDWRALDCVPMVGGGSQPTTTRNFCLFNEDPTAEITNMGHYGTRPSGSAPGLACTPANTSTLDSRASDTMGTVTIGAGDTACTISFAVNMQGGAPHVLVSSPTGSVFTGYTPATGSIALTGVVATNKFTYLAFAPF